jgi:hypothetical protein
MLRHFLPEIDRPRRAKSMKKAKVFEQLTAVQVEAIKTALRSGRHITHSQV